MSALVLSACGPAMEVRDPEPVLASSVRELRTPQGKTPQGKTPQGKTPQGTEANNPWLVDVNSFQFRVSNDSLVAAKAQLNGSRIQGITIPGGYVLPVPPLPPVVLEQASARVVIPPVWYEPTLPLATFKVMEIQGPVVAGAPLPLVNPTREARIMGTFIDMGPYGPTDAANLLQPQYRSATRPNADVHFYRVQLKDDAGNWVDFCSTESGSPPNAAMFLPSFIDTVGLAYSAPNYLGIACHDGTAVKCARWGYKPWTSLTPTGSSPPEPVGLAPYWEACFKAAMANYCEDGFSYTQPNTIIDIWDRHRFIAPTPEWVSYNDPQGANGPSAFTSEAGFNARGTVCLERERYGALPAACNSGTWQIMVTGGTHCYEWSEASPPTNRLPSSTCSAQRVFIAADPFEKGALEGCIQQKELTADAPLVFVANWTNGCRHGPFSTGYSLAKDCNWLTRAVCESTGYAYCCGTNSYGQLEPNNWNAGCVAKAYDIVAAPPIIVPPTGGVITP
ncbi:hypothetical protein HUA75_36880 [Myxococcus sp. CA040A]|nr:hypothetical protein [Myxococcus sp. CA040A]